MTQDPRRLFMWACALALPSSLLMGCFKTEISSAQLAQLAPPEISLTDMAPMLAEKRLYTVMFAANADDRVPIEKLELYFSEDQGSSFNLLATLEPGTSSYAWTTPDREIKEAVLRLRAINSRANSSTITSKPFMIRKRPPVVTEETLNNGASQLISRVRKAALGGSCESFPGFPEIFNQVLVETRINEVPIPAKFEAPCVKGRWNYSPPELTADQKQTFIVSQLDPVGHISPVVTREWISDTTAPVFSAAFKINAGDAVTKSNFVKLDLEATDNLTSIVKLCLKYNTTEAPAENDPCWYRVGTGSLSGHAPGKQLTLKGFDYQIGYVPGTYLIRAWAEDQLGNQSVLTSPAGFQGKDLAQISYRPGKPALINDFLVTTSDWNGIYPVDSSFLQTSKPMLIQWNVATVTGDDPLPARPVSLYYTLDNQNYTAIATNLPLGAGCSAGFNGCYTWTNPPPATGYVRVRIVVTNDQGMRTAASSLPLNVTNFKLIAGNTDDGSVENIPEAGANSSGAIFHVDGVDKRSDPGRMVIADDGTLFVRDIRRGLLKVSPKDSNLTRFLPSSATIQDGPFTEATVKAVHKIMLDNKGRLLLMDDGRIRRADLNSGTIKTLIGGGTGQDLPPPVESYPAPGANPLAIDLKRFGAFAKPAGAVLPNGDLYFLMTAMENGAGAGKIFIYKESNQTLYSLQLTGTVRFANLGERNAQDVATNPSMRFSSFGIVTQPDTGGAEMVLGHYEHAVNGGAQGYLGAFDPTTGISYFGQPDKIIPTPSSQSGYGYIDGYYFNGRDGTLYELNRYHQGIHLVRYDRTNKVWVRVVGTEELGACADGTPALNCAIDPIDAFVGAQSRVFFVDRGGIIRAVDDEGKVLTIAGQSRSFGDGLPATAARFNLVMHIAQGKDKNIIILDAMEHRIREFSPGGSISLLAGNGNRTYATTGVLAEGQPLPGRDLFRTSFGLVADRATGDVFYNATSPVIVSRLNRSGDKKGQWENIAGTGTASWLTSDGLKGNEYKFFTYALHIFGFNGTELVLTTNLWDNLTTSTVHPRWNTAEKTYNLYNASDCATGCHYSSFLKTVNASTGQLGHLAGFAGAYAARGFHADGDSVALSQNPGVFNNALSSSQWDESRGWLMLHAGTKRIVAMKANANISTLASLDNSAVSFAAAKNADGKDFVYYCAGTGSVFKRDVDARSETKLELPPGMGCTGRSMLFTGTSIVFPVIQNGTHAIGEITTQP